MNLKTLGLCSCLITLGDDFVLTRTDGTAVRSQPRDRKEASIVEGNLSDLIFYSSTREAEERGNWPRSTTVLSVETMGLEFYPVVS